MYVSVICAYIFTFVSSFFSFVQFGHFDGQSRRQSLGLRLRRSGGHASRNHHRLPQVWCFALHPNQHRHEHLRERRSAVFLLCRSVLGFRSHLGFELRKESRKKATIRCFLSDCFPFSTKSEEQSITLIVVFFEFESDFKAKCPGRYGLGCVPGFGVKLFVSS